MGCLSFFVISLMLSSIVYGNTEKRQILRWDQYVNQRWNTVDEHGKLTILYKVDTSYPIGRMIEIRRGMAVWQNRTCINIVEVPFAEDIDQHYILFTNDANSGCYSHVGMTPEAYQEINLPQRGCFGPLPGTLLHEIGHTLGLCHQHQRYDRDDYISVDMSNTDGGYEIYPADNTNLNDVPYDHSSIMHYYPRAFALDNTRDVIIAKDPRYQHNMGNMDGLTFFDTKQINIEYCSETCAGSGTQCARGGYPDPRDCSRCHCIEGFKDLCNTVDDSDPKCPNAGVVDVALDTWSCITFDPYQCCLSCNWHFQTVADKTIDFKFDENSPFGVFCEKETFGFPCRHYVEVKYKDQLDKRGPRVCCDNPSYFNGPEGYVTSDHNEILVTFRSVRVMPTTYAGFIMCYRVTN